MHGHAKRYAYKRTYDREQAHAQRKAELQWRQRDRVAHWRDAEQQRHAVGRHRRDKAWDQAGVVQYADRDDLEREYRRRQRRSEQRREHRAHAAQRDKAHILFVELQKPPDAVADAASNLKRRSLASGRAAEKVRYRSCGKNDRHEQDRHPVAVVDRVDDIVRALALGFAGAVDKRDGKAAGGQQKYEPLMLCPEARDKVDRKVERRAYKSAYEPRHDRQQHPAVESSEIFSDAYSVALKLLHFLIANLRCPYTYFALARCRSFRQKSSRAP